MRCPSQAVLATRALGFSFPHCEKTKAPLLGLVFFGGERGIRTLDTDLSPYASLAGKCLRPLGQLSVLMRYCYLVLLNRGAILLDSPPKINFIFLGKGPAMLTCLLIRMPCVRRERPVPSISRPPPRQS